MEWQDEHLGPEPHQGDQVERVQNPAPPAADGLQVPGSPVVRRSSSALVRAQQRSQSARRARELEARAAEGSAAARLEAMRAREKLRAERRQRSSSGSWVFGQVGLVFLAIIFTGGLGLIPLAIWWVWRGARS